MVLSSRITIDRKSKIITIKLRSKIHVEDIQIYKKLALAYDKGGEIVKIYLLPFSLDEFLSGEMDVRKSMASAPLTG